VLISITCSLLALYFTYEIRETSEVRFMPEISLDKCLTRAVLNYAGNAGDLVIEAWRSRRRGSRRTHWFARGSHNG